MAVIPRSCPDSSAVGYADVVHTWDCFDIDPLEKKVAGGNVQQARNDKEDSIDNDDNEDTSKTESQQRLLPCELIQLSPNVSKNKGYEGTFHQISR